MTFISYAQNFEDVVLWRALGSVTQGFYIDVGAGHPDVDSVTRAFYERGWRGINVEPVPDYVVRLRASRPQDVTIDASASDGVGTAELLVVPGTGLSTLEAEHLPPAMRAGTKIRVATATLADICRRYAPPDIHFLKIDVEGSERRVLAGADFANFRPWIVVIEATVPMSSVANHETWEGLLLAAQYRFVLFDGLNRFYVAAERHEAIASSLAAPANVTDDFLRVADGEWTRRIAEAETRAALLAARAEATEARAAALVDRLHATELQALGDARRTEENAARAERQGVQLQWQGVQLQRQAAALQRLRVARERVVDCAETALAAAAQATAQAREASDWLAAMRASSSWRVTSPLRLLARTAQRLRHRGRHPVSSDPVEVGPPPIAPPAVLAYADVDAETGAEADSASDAGAAGAIVAGIRRGRLRRTVHQFHSGSAPADAITNAMLLTQRVLRGLGYASEIFVEHRPDSLAGELRLIDELPLHDDYVLLVHHSMGHDALARVLGRPPPKILVYHNITPPEFLAHDAYLQRYAVLGRNQLGTLRRHVVAALADSEYNALELRGLDYEAPRACMLLFDVAGMLEAAAQRPPTRGRAPFTILFVGRLIASKAQADLVDAFASFRRRFDVPTRLVLVGRDDSGKVSYGETVRARIRAHRLGNAVTLAGLVSDAELRDRYAAADLYVSLSHHEGFGVPLVEAMAHGVPVLAWRAGAVADTLGGPDGLLDDRTPDVVATRLLALARDPAARAALAERQRRGLDRFRLERQVPLLVQALTAAGAAPPEQVGTDASLRLGMRFTVTGHVNRSYSLAAINRDLALALEAERPGSVRLVPVETVPTDDLSEVPAEVADAVARLVRRPPHPTGPEIVISQHYPVYRPDSGGDACLALFFWEESLIPADTVARLSHGFRAVLAPTRFVAKALVDSGLSIPVHVVGHVPSLDGFAALADPREARAMHNLAHDDGADGAGKRVFTFLHVSSCFPRKGVDLLLAAYARSFRRDDAVRLVVKGFPNPHNDAAAQIARLQADDPQAPAVELIDRDLDQAELQALYLQADALVLPTRGEGFNLPAAEAMAAGLPLIVTGFGGHRDFCGPGTARLVDWRFAPSVGHLATPHSVWAEPDVEDLATALREAVDDRLAAVLRTRRARAAVQSRFAREPFIERLTAAARHALLAPPPSPVRLGWISTWQVRCGIAEYSRHLLAVLPRNALAGVVVFADNRTASQDDDGTGLRVRSAWQCGNPDGVQGLLDTIAQEDPEVVVVQHQPGLFSWAVLPKLLAGLAGRVVVVTLHNTRDLLDMPASQRIGAVSALSTVARVTVHTLRDLNFLRDLGLIDNVVLLPHGAPAGLAATPPRSHPVAGPGELRSPAANAAQTVADRGPLIGCYGFFLPDKGIPQLIEALAILRRRWPAARLRLVNAAYGAPDSDDEIAQCRDVVAAAALGEAVEFRTEFRSDADSLALLSKCDVIALPYQRSKEASSAAVRMALAAGPPVVVTDLPLFEEAADAVMRIEGGDAAALADGIGELLGDPARRGALQSAARLWLDARNWTAIARRLHGMLLGLARSPLAEAAPVAADRDARVPVDTVSAAPFSAHKTTPGEAEKARHG